MNHIEITPEQELAAMKVVANISHTTAWSDPDALRRIRDWFSRMAEQRIARLTAPNEKEQTDA